MMSMAHRSLGKLTIACASAWAGEASIAITMDIYSHLMANMQTDAAAKVDAAFRAAKKPE